MNDSTTNVRELRDQIAQFVEERDWRQFHDAKNLSMSIAIEAAELMEHFQWVRNDELSVVTDDPGKLAAIREEIADVGCYLLALCNTLRLDLSTAIRDKLAQNARKYPADQYRGRYRLE